MEDDIYPVRWRLQALGHPDVRKCRRTRSDVIHDNLDWAVRKGCRRKSGGRRSNVIQCSGEKKCRELLGEMFERGAFQIFLEPLFEP